ncbi:hypothetical protein [Streptomyces lonarensis]|uniref:Uncharacterized protein n=1 Tax=Streptomyces lonarensis TaxID=700599 RepID=A0A7X6CYI0_9ACTN|nr:hypothetical protein [Streptomyces lonarensis]NJQ04887.1 hypothetical protein [Streptomyces lonarensis]
MTKHPPDQGSNGGSPQLIATDNHPLWLPAAQQWIDAVDLEPGTQLYPDDGTLVDVTAVTASAIATISPSSASTRTMQGLQVRVERLHRRARC